MTKGKASRHKTSAIVTYQREIREWGWCAVCHFRVENDMQIGMPQSGIDMHHINENDQHGQRRLGEGDVVMLCGYHHDGDIDDGETQTTMREKYGASFKYNSRDFRIWTEDALPDLKGKGTKRWQMYQNEIIYGAELAREMYAVDEVFGRG